MAMHGDMGGKVCGWGGGETPGGEKYPCGLALGKVNNYGLVYCGLIAP